MPTPIHPLASVMPAKIARLRIMFFYLQSINTSLTMFGRRVKDNRRNCKPDVGWGENSGDFSRKVESGGSVRVECLKMVQDLRPPSRLIQFFGVLVKKLARMEGIKGISSLMHMAEVRAPRRKGMLATNQRKPSSRLHFRLIRIIRGSNLFQSGEGLTPLQIHIPCCARPHPFSAVILCSSDH